MFVSIYNSNKPQITGVLQNLKVRLWHCKATMLLGNPQSIFRMVRQLACGNEAKWRENVQRNRRVLTHLVSVSLNEGEIGHAEICETSCWLLAKHQVQLEAC